MTSSDRAVGNAATCGRSTADGRLTLDATRGRGFAAPPVARRPSSLLQPKLEADRGRVVEGDRVGVRPVLRKILRADIEDPLLIRRVETECRIGRRRDDSLVYGIVVRPRVALRHETSHESCCSDGVACAVAD